MDSVMDINLWLKTFENANYGLDQQELGLACLCMLEDPVAASISKFLPRGYTYQNVQKGLLKVFYSLVQDDIARSGFLE